MRDAKEVTEMEEGKGEGGTEGLEGLLDGVFDSPKKPVAKTPVLPAKVLPEETVQEPPPENKAGTEKAEASPASSTTTGVLGVITNFLLVILMLFGIPWTILHFVQGKGGYIVLFVYWALFSKISKEFFKSSLFVILAYVIYKLFIK